jgi:hypothetical protein
MPVVLSDCPENRKSPFGHATFGIPAAQGARSFKPVNAYSV